MKRPFPILILAGLFAAAPGGVPAMNLTPLLQDTPAQLFTVQDYGLFDVALKKALDEARQAEVVQWENPETRAGGSVTVVQEYQREGNACKRLRIDNRAGQRVGYSVFDFCRQADGRWVLAPMGQ
jgi:surface antigen